MRTKPGGNSGKEMFSPKSQFHGELESAGPSEKLLASFVKVTTPLAMPFPTVPLKVCENEPCYRGKFGLSKWRQGECVSLLNSSKGEFGSCQSGQKRPHSVLNPNG